MKTGRFVLAIVALPLVLLGGATSSGCAHSCSDVYFFSGAVLTLHLPPASDVASPEKVTACRGSTCATATLPANGPKSVDFSIQEVSGTLSLDAGKIRLFRVFWMVNDVPASDPHDTYDVTVTDAARHVTGRLSGTVTYVGSMPGGGGCGTTWNATLSD